MLPNQLELLLENHLNKQVVSIHFKAGFDLEANVISPEIDKLRGRGLIKRKT